MTEKILEIKETKQGAFFQLYMDVPRCGVLPCPIRVGSDDWFMLLQFSNLESFKFFPQNTNFPSFLVRREKREAGDIYFSAYKRIEGKLRKFYLGKPENVTLEKLHDAGKRFRCYQQRMEPVPEPIERKDPSTSTLAGTHALDLRLEVDSLHRRLALAEQTILEQQNMLSLFDEFNAELLIRVGEIVTQWNEKAKGKQSRFDRTWQHALHLLRELNEALKIDSPGSAEEQPAEGGN